MEDWWRCYRSSNVSQPSFRGLDMLRLTGAALVVAGVCLLVWGVTHLNAPRIFVSDSVLMPGRYYLGHTRLQAALSGGIASVALGWMLFRGEKRQRK
jgi:hypothetical protein